MNDKGEYIINGKCGRITDIDNQNQTILYRHEELRHKEGVK